MTFPPAKRRLAHPYPPFEITLSGYSYRSGIDIQPEEFYAMLEKTEDMPTTSTPSPGEFQGNVPASRRNRPGYPLDPHLLWPERHLQCCPNGSQPNARRSTSRW
jgi:hypothetical protein